MESMGSTAAPGDVADDLASTKCLLERACGEFDAESKLAAFGTLILLFFMYFADGDAGG